VPLSLALATTVMAMMSHATPSAAAMPAAAAEAAAIAGPHATTACPGASKACNCGWTKGGALCPAGRDDGSECFCRCCCPYKPTGFKCKWHDPHPGPQPPPPPPIPPPPPPFPPPPPAPPGTGLTAVHVKGNHLVDAAGNLVVLRGVSHSGSEYTCIHSSGIFEGKMDASFVAGLKSWKNLNAVRLPLNEDCWLGINGVKKEQGGAAYQAKYKEVVTLLTSNHIAVLADLHWTAPGGKLATGQQVKTWMPMTLRACNRLASVSGFVVVRH
jgi:hypothetical protein